MGKRQLRLDPLDAAIVYIRTALGDRSPGLPLALRKPRFDQGVDDRQAFARELLARQLPAGNVGENACQLGVAQVADFGAEEDFGRSLGRAKPFGPVNQSRQLGGQPR